MNSSTQAQINKKMKIKIEISNQVIITTAIVFLLLIAEYLMAVLELNYIISISINIALCIGFNIFNYKRFSHFQTEKDLQQVNKTMAFTLLFTNLTCLIGVVIILIRLHK